LLAAERGHYELAAGRRDAALELLRTMARQTSQCGMIPEQVWDAGDIPERFLFNGHPTGSGMPLAWAHAEYIKLLRSLHDNAIWDRAPQTEQRYLRDHRTANFQIWTPVQRRGWLDPGKDLRIDIPVPARLRWSSARHNGASETFDSSLGLHCATLATHELSPGATVRIALEPLIKPDKSTKIPSTFIVRVKASRVPGELRSLGRS
jgi:glucoamylase